MSSVLCPFYLVSSSVMPVLFFVFVLGVGGVGGLCLLCLVFSVCYGWCSPSLELVFCVCCLLFPVRFV